ncbi:hypothetical protein HIM_08637 [Hirsutella minnesotensis 3608]|uniref:Alpha/beta hydrolase fold-3 domain-containing protein n=1 Tax=Hirsutella minnesotensis 3608 TaxID=1043627 RepID=A0A0F7ZY70_9HYPO|nr:hypothetical protein HIM_08637 [Hirsutella minnesotensis 3608]
MIDHVLGRPSSKSRRLQVLAVLSFWSFYLLRGHKHGPPGARVLSRILSRRFTAWQACLATLMYLYGAGNFSALVGLGSPDPLANMYDATYFRATWVLTALDAGFWTAMKIRSKWLRDLAGIVFAIYYLFATERADEKVRKVRAVMTVEHLRISWNKGISPYLSSIQRLTRPRFTRWPPRQIRIPRPANSDYKEPVAGWLYYDGPVADLEHHTKVVLDIPGGGFVAMDPRCNDDKLFAWAAKSGLPILSLDYKKAPEFPYPYALNECFDVYATIIATKGRCLGMSGRETPRVIISGDSAGGNLAVASTLMILETSSAPLRRGPERAGLPAPDGLVCFYPSLDTNIGNWMSDEQMSLISDRKARQTNRSIVQRKSMQYNALVGTPHHSDGEDETPTVEAPDAMPRSPYECQPEYTHSGPRSLSSAGVSETRAPVGMSHHSEPLKTRLATSSTISYFNDRILTPEMMRAIIILYIGPHNRPDFSRDYLLSPVLAPDSLLARFPKTYFMTGERDPLVDDTVVFAGRLKRAKEAAAREKLGVLGVDAAEIDAAEVMLLPGVSHGFLQFPGVYPPAWKHFERSATWFEQLFSEADQARNRRLGRPEAAGGSSRQHHIGESSGEEDKPLEISMTKLTRGRSSTNSQGGDAAASPQGTRANGEGAREKGGKKNGKRVLSKNKSLVKLKSTDDLLGRRMHGLAGGLTGQPEDD